MEKDLELLHQKIDFLTEQVLLTQRRQREWEELRKDLTPIATELFRTAVKELDEVSPFFSYEDALFLIKKFLRNTRTLIGLFEKMESATDFIQDITPLTKDMFQSTLQTLDKLEQKGYFQFFKAALEMVDNVITSFSEQDVRQLGDNIVLILNTVKQLTQPEMLSALNNGLALYQHLNVDPPEKVSWFKIMTELNDPDVKRALLVGLTILKNVATSLSVQNLEAPDATRNP